MRKMVWAAALTPLLLIGCAETQQATDATVAAAKAQVNPTLSTSDATFLTEGARGGLAEVQMARLALQKSRTPALRRFADMMIADHGRANQDMTALAQRKEISPPTSVGAQHQATYDQLAALRGRAFDVAYGKAMVADHKEDLDQYRTEARDGTDPDVKAFAARNVPILERHLQAAERLPQR